MTMTDAKFAASNDRIVLSSDELEGVNGGCLFHPAPSNASPGAQGAAMGGTWNYSGSQSTWRRSN